MHAALNLSWVTDQLAVGGSFRTDLISAVAQAGFSAVVDCRDECRDDEEALQACGVTLLHLPTPDLCELTLADLTEGVAWVVDRLEAGLKVFIHCEHGIGRSPLLLCCVLVACGDSPLAALERAKAARSCISPSPRQLEGYLAFCRAYLESSDGLPTFEELASVAYRHLSAESAI